MHQDGSDTDLCEQRLNTVEEPYLENHKADDDLTLHLRIKAHLDHVMFDATNLITSLKTEKLLDCRHDSDLTGEHLTLLSKKGRG